MLTRRLSSCINVSWEDILRGTGAKEVQDLGSTRCETHCFNP